MYPYWVMTIVPMLLSLFFFERKKDSTGAIIVFFIIFVFFVGLRDKVGMDWNNYLYKYEFAYRDTFMEAISGVEPGFVALNWLMASSDMGIYGVNFVSAITFSVGLFAYAKHQCVQFWSAIAVVMPYLVIVVAMSATRQAMAIGILFFALAHWHHTKIVTKASLITLAFLFHASAIAFLPLVIFELKTHPVIRYLLLMISVWLSYVFLVDVEHVRYYNEIYIEQNIQSAGAIIHILLNFFPALLYFIFRKKIAKIYRKDKILYALSILSLLALPATVISSTGVDRLSLYFSVIQMKIYSALPFMSKNRTDRIIIQLVIFGFTILVLFVWLKYSNHSFAYIPYRNYWID